MPSETCLDWRSSVSGLVEKTPEVGWLVVEQDPAEWSWSRIWLLGFCGHDAEFYFATEMSLTSIWKPRALDEMGLEVCDESSIVHLRNGQCARKIANLDWAISGGQFHASIYLGLFKLSCRTSKHAGYAIRRDFLCTDPHASKLFLAYSWWLWSEWSFW